MPSPEQFMRHALRLALRGRGWVEPNPMVGAVLVRNGEIVAEGWHQRFGGPHAEVNCVRDAAEKHVDPSTCEMYVTLEPCSHHGKTPPCVDAILAARVPAVHAAMVDPFPQVAGQGIAKLSAAGVRVTVGYCEHRVRRLMEPYLKLQATGLPWVIAKWAQTVDGRIATATSDSKWISSERSRRIVHRIRARVDAIMVGIGTALADDPMLTARNIEMRRVARRIVVDPQVKLPATAALVRSLAEPGAAPVTLVVAEAVHRENPPRMQQLASQGVEFFPAPLAADASPDAPRLALRPLIQHLARDRNAANVLVEGGGRTFGSLLEEGLIDQMLVFVAPRVLGDPAAVAAVVRPHPPALIHRTPALSLRRTRRIDDDVLLDYRTAPPAP